MTRDDILTSLNESRAQLEDALRGLSDEQLQSAPVLGEWTIKDILAHLTAWEVELVTLLGRLERGHKVRAGTFLWKDPEVEAQNQKWHKDYRSRPLDRVLADWRGVRPQTVRRVMALSEAALAESRPALYDLTLEQIIRAYTFKHEAEHAAEIMDWRRQTGLQ